MQTFHEEINANLMRTIRRTLHSMRAKQYQIVAVVGILTEKEYEVRALFSSFRILNKERVFFWFPQMHLDKATCGTLCSSPENHVELTNIPDAPNTFAHL